MTLHDVALDDKFDLGKQRIFLSGAQAVIRMLLMQRERDRRAGLNTAGFVSGYRGSPLGGLDQQFWRARSSSPIRHRLPAGAQRGSHRLLGRSRPSFSAKAGMMASSRSGTARGRASTARATSFATPILPARRNMAACSP